MAERTSLGRRTLLGGIVASGALVAGAGWRAAEQGLIGLDDHDAYAPWDDWANDPRRGARALAAAAILAPSPHNTQPWHFHLSEQPGRMTVHIALDSARGLGPLDPFSREALIDIGAASETAAIAATALRCRARVEFLSGRGSVARIVACSDDAVAQSLLLRWIGRRHTNRGRYATGSVGPLLKAAIAAEAASDGVGVDLFDASSAAGEDFVRGTLQATLAINADRGMTDASKPWFRSTPRDTLRHRDASAWRERDFRKRRTALRSLPRNRRMPSRRRCGSTPPGMSISAPRRGSACCA